MVVLHKEKIEKMSQILLQKKTIEIDDIVSVLGNRPFSTSDSFKKYLEEKSS